jgi:hypothetical protein
LLQAAVMARSSLGISDCPLIDLKLVLHQRMPLVAKLLAYRFIEIVSD